MNTNNNIEHAASTLTGQMSDQQLLEAWHTAYDGLDMGNQVQMATARLKRRWVGAELTKRGVQFVAGSGTLEG